MINDLPEAEKLDQFLRALGSNVRVRVELRGPTNLQQVAMCAECTDAILSRVSSQDSCQKWQKSNANIGGNYQRLYYVSSPTRPEPMEIRAIKRNPLTSEERQKLYKNNGFSFVIN